MEAEEAGSLVGSAAVIDVREAYEFDAGHIGDSINIPIGQIIQRREELDRETVTLVVCQIGQRSGLVADFLSEHGFAAHNLVGGLEVWVTSGLPLVSEGKPGKVVDGYARNLFGDLITTDPGAYPETKGTSPTKCP